MADGVFEGRTDGRKNMFGLALRILAPTQCLAVKCNLARVRIGGYIAGWFDCDLSKHCRHHVGVQNPQCLSQCRMARRLAIPAETQPVKVLARHNFNLCGSFLRRDLVPFYSAIDSPHPQSPAKSFGAEFPWFGSTTTPLSGWVFSSGMAHQGLSSGSNRASSQGSA